MIYWSLSKNKFQVIRHDICLVFQIQLKVAALQFKFNFWFIGKQKQTILLENNKRFGENQIFEQQLAKLTSNQQTKNQIFKIYTSLFIFNYSSK